MAGPLSSIQNLAVEHPFYFSVGPTSSKAFKPNELLIVQLRAWIQWFMFAHRHHRAAQVLAHEVADERARSERDMAAYRRVPQSPMLHDQLMMSMGFALENLAKGALIATMDEVLTANGKLVSRLKHHNIPRIVCELGIDLSPAHQEFVAMAKVMISGPNARYPARSSVGEPIVTSSSWSLDRLWQRFEEVFELLALALLDRNQASVQIILPQYEADEVCRFDCSHADWLSWQLHGKLPAWLPVPPLPTNSWRAQAEAALDATKVLGGG